MTKEQFKRQGWTGGMKAKILLTTLYTGIYDVVSVDFEYETVEVEIDGQCLDFACEKIELIEG